MAVLDIVKPGVLSGSEAKKLFAYAKENKFAIPAVNVVGTDSVNAVLEVAAKVNSPIIVQFSNGGAGFYAGKGLKTSDAAILGGVSGALHVHTMAEAYGVPVILHTDHAARKLLPWIDGLLDAGRKHFEKTGKPLYTSHMLDLSEESLEENIGTCVDYFKTMSDLDMMIEIELGITGGEEDGVDNSQKYISEKYSTDAKPVDFVFHGGSGSELHEIREAIDYGVIKMNIDTDTQWATWNGVREFVAKNYDYLQGQIGNPDGEDKPNKGYYDPRKWLRAGQEGMIARLEVAYSDLCSIDKN